MTAKKTARSGIVYSSEQGRMCPRCGEPVAQCGCDAKNPAASATQNAVIRVSRETKGRRGKGVTVVTGLPLRGAALDELGSRLKRLCGSGGTVKDGVIEVQGEHRDVLVAELARQGWTVKRSGG